MVDLLRFVVSCFHQVTASLAKDGILGWTKGLHEVLELSLISVPSDISDEQSRVGSLITNWSWSGCLLLLPFLLFLFSILLFFLLSAFILSELSLGFTGFDLSLISFRLLLFGLRFTYTSLDTDRLDCIFLLRVGICNNIVNSLFIIGLGYTELNGQVSSLELSAIHCFNGFRALFTILEFDESEATVLILS